MRLGMLMTVGILEKLMRSREAPFPPLGILVAPCRSFSKDYRGLRRREKAVPVCRDADTGDEDADARIILPPPRSKLNRESGFNRRTKPAPRWSVSSYFTSTVAPASVNFFLMDSASSLPMPSLIGFGA